MYPVTSTELEAIISLFYFQKDGADAFFDYLKKNSKGNGVIELPTGAGKSYLLAELIKRFTGLFGARILVVSHTKKIVQQDYDSTVKLWPEGKPLFGINSEGLGRRNKKNQVLFCGIQSVYKSAKDIGKVNLLIIDEAHRVNMTDSIQYQKFINDLLEINPNMRVCGLSASPFRMGTGLIYGPSKDLLFDDLVYKANTKELMAQGYLARPVTPAVEKKNRIDTSGVKIRGNDFVDTDLEKRVNIPTLVASQIHETLIKCQGLKSIAVFAVNINHAETIAKEFRRQGETSIAVVHSKIEEDDDKLIQDFKDQKVRVLISVNMFVEGFDAPNIQAIVDIKPTLSPGRYVQMYGRGFRIWIGKKTFLVLDFAGNVGTHGPVDQVVPEKKEEKMSSKTPRKHCERCGQTCHARMKVCPYCGWMFPLPEVDDNTNSKAGDLSVISEPRWFDVTKLFCAKSKRKPLIIAHYYCDGKKFKIEISFDKDGITWLKKHLGDDIPFDAKNFFNGGYRSKIKAPKRIFVDEAGDFSKILEYQF